MSDVPIGPVGPVGPIELLVVDSIKTSMPIPVPMPLQLSGRWSSYSDWPLNLEMSDSKSDEVHSPKPIGLPFELLN